MTQIRISIAYLSGLAMLSIPIVWAAFWYNRNAYSVVGSATQQLGVYLLPMVAIAIRAWLPKVSAMATSLFFCTMIPLVTLAYTERADAGWIYSLLEIPVLWIFGAYSCVSLSKHRRSQNNA